VAGVSGRRVQVLIVRGNGRERLSVGLQQLSDWSDQSAGRGAETVFEV
jgi:hypothetical protein